MVESYKDLVVWQKSMLLVTYMFKCCYIID